MKYLLCRQRMLLALSGGPSEVISERSSGRSRSVAIFGAVFVEVVAHVHDLVPFGEGGGVVAEFLAHERVEFFNSAHALFEEFQDLRVCLFVGAGRVLAVGLFRRW